jgi:hypothetical protein
LSSWVGLQWIINTNVEEDFVVRIREWIAQTSTSFTSSVKTGKISFSKFSDNLSTGMNFLRRRFSSSDLQSDLEAEGIDHDVGMQYQMPRKGPSPSAPSSPSRATSITGMAGNMGAQVQGLTRGLFSSQKQQYNKDRCKILLIIDDPHTDW